MDLTRTCPDCGAVLPEQAPKGLCPKCLVALASGPGPEAGAPADDEDSDFRPRRAFGDYELISQIAAGGMGVVWRARQRSLHRVVALKLIRTGWLAADEEVQRFRTEAEAAANLDHQNIVPIYEIGEQEGWHFFSMKLIEGGSLAQRIARPAGRLSPTEGASLLAKVARAVHHAHQRGVLHRDLKPSNILLDEQGQPHLTDFGLAKLVASESELTQSMAVLGTPAYMPPEQAAGHSRQITTSGDVYSLGAIFYELLVGRAPFPTDSPLNIIRQVLELEPRPPSALQPSIDRDLETICLKCLEKNPQHRYGTAQELAQDLERWVQHEPITARPVTRWERAAKWVRRHPLAAGLYAAVTACLLLGGAGYNWWRRAQVERERGDASRVQQELQGAENHFARHEAHLALASLARLLRESPDNRVAAERLLTALRQRVFLLPSVTQVGSGLVLMTNLPGGGSSDITPDRRWRLTGIGSNRLEIVEAKTGQVRLALPGAHERVIRDARFSLDGRFILSGGADYTAKVHDANTGRCLLTLRHSNTVHHVEMSPDGTLLLTASRDGVARLWNAATGHQLAEMAHGDSLNTARFNADGSLLVTACDDATVRVWDGATGRPVSEPVRLPEAAEDAWFAPENRGLAVRFGGTQSVAFVLSAPAQFVASSRAELASLNVPASHPGFAALQRQISDLEGAATTILDLSSHERLAVAVQGDRLLRVWDIGTLQPVTGPLVHEAAVSSARFSPDGRRIVSGTTGRMVRVWDARSGAPLCDWIESPEEFERLQFSSDGRWVVCSAGWKWPFPTCHGPAPPWLSRLAESLARSAEPKAAEEFFALAETLSGRGSSPESAGSLGQRIPRA